MDTKLSKLTKFELMEIVNDCYKNEPEQRKYLCLRPKRQLIQMIEAKMKAPQPSMPSYAMEYRPPNLMTPPTYQSMDHLMIQSKYGSFLERLSDEETPMPMPRVRSKKGHSKDETSVPPSETPTPLPSPHQGSVRPMKGGGHF